MPNHRPTAPPKAPADTTANATFPPDAVPDAFLAQCPSRTVLTRLVEKWTLLILVALADGPRRFGALRRQIEGVSQKMLTQSLRRLERDGLVDRRLYDEMPLRVEYSLTALGRDALPLVAQLKRWAEAHLHTIEARREAFDRALAPPDDPRS
ncbi:MAG: helix-turn-helix domain-containing protein [Acidobacteriota bacterium]